jgi:hypothetical protein
MANREDQMISKQNEALKAYFPFLYVDIREPGEIGGFRFAIAD